MGKLHCSVLFQCPAVISAVGLFKMQCYTGGKKAWYAGNGAVKASSLVARAFCISMLIAFPDLISAA